MTKIQYGSEIEEWKYTCLKCSRVTYWPGLCECEKPKCPRCWESPEFEWWELYTCTTKQEQKPKKIEKIIYTQTKNWYDTGSKDPIIEVLNEVIDAINVLNSK